MCRTESDLGMQERVCGLNNRTYPSICHMVQQSGTQVRFSQACNRSDCPDSPVSVRWLLFMKYFTPCINHIGMWD